MAEKTTVSSKIFSFLKKLLIVLIILQLLPFLFINFGKKTKEYLNPRPKFGYLTINGTIYDSTFYVKKIRSLRKNNEIEGLLLKINSPGGMPGSSQAILDALLKFKEKKPIVTLVENVCASGGYYIATASNKIISPASAFIGSIGNYLQLPNVKNLLDDWKIKFKFIQTGKYKTTGNPFQELSPEEEKFLQELSDDVYYQFITDVAKYRKLNPKEHKIWADGKIFTATQSLTLNLIDKIGGMDDAIEELKSLKNIPTESDIKLVKIRPISGLRKFLQGEDEEEDGSWLHYFNPLKNYFSLFLQQLLAIKNDKNNIARTACLPTVTY